MPRSVADILREEVDRANAIYTSARTHFWRVTADAPHRLQDPKELRLREDAFRIQTEAMIEYSKALKRFDDFLINGTVPEDIQ